MQFIRFAGMDTVAVDSVIVSVYMPLEAKLSVNNG